MTEFTGKDLVVVWTTTSGTTTLTGDHRTASIEPSVNLISATAGSDADETYLVGVKDARVTFSGVAQSDGTATEDELIEGMAGTLEVGPEGTTTGNRRYSIPAISMGARYNWPYDNVVELSVEWQKNGALTRDVYPA